MIEMAAKKKLFLIAGHGEGDPGACSIWGQEANYTRELAKLVKTAIGSRMSVTLYDTNKNCYAQSKRGNVPTYSDYDMTVEIHFNAKANRDTQGWQARRTTGRQPRSSRMADTRRTPSTSPNW